jgi:hypothetical protein
MNPIFTCPITQEAMTDPVIDNEGVSYERAAILAWLRQGHATSPVTRKPLTEADLKPNLALRALIEEATRPAPHAPASGPPQIDVRVAPVADATDLYCVRLSVPDKQEGATTMPVTLINVIDNSGSMGSSSMATPHASEAGQLSRSDLVRHAVATEIELLQAPNALGVVLFDHAVTTPLAPTIMDGRGKMLAKTVLPLIQPNGGTNIWAGLYQALTLAAIAPPDHNVVILLQTDGESDPAYNPPRGIAAAFRAWLDANPAVAARITVHTIGYGFGKALDMPLLRAIAEIGGGHCNYIPDGSMVGTVFIHNMANLLTCQYRGVRIHVPEVALTVPVGFLQSGQAREFLMTVPATGSHSSHGSHGFTVAVSSMNAPDATIEVFVAAGTAPVRALGARGRTALLRSVGEALTAAETHNTYTDFRALRDELAALAAAEEPGSEDAALLAALRSDLCDPDPAKGQLVKAFATPEAFLRWGRHYVPTVLCAHASQWAINFKDAASTVYGGPTTRALIQRGDVAFLSVPSPKPAVRMAAVHNSTGPCFLPASQVLMADGTRQRCDQIRAGQVVATLNGITRVRCVIRTEVSHADIVRLHTGSNAGTNADGGFTLWHPVFVGRRWQYPADLGRVEHVATDAIYNFVLDRGHMIDIDGVKTCTMGHGFTGPVIGHPYFGAREPGKRNILDDLENDPGWFHGAITWRNLEVTHDPVTGLINGYRQQQQQQTMALPA